MQESYKRVRVLIETTERCFRGQICLPEREQTYRLSDHLNGYGKDFLCMSDVEIAERGQQWRIGQKQAFVAVAVPSITYVTPLDDGV